MERAKWREGEGGESGEWERKKGGKGEEEEKGRRKNEGEDGEHREIGGEEETDWMELREWVEKERKGGEKGGREWKKIREMGEG